ncbi:alpha/beta hydrolase [Anianabacter salinae]|uniref:alpha/beta hydrolase n=1 Tax=Anianabacter salinae TaxID=2851023 RepID=UPI00225E6E72|nr:alpha/beta hydrolase [Anianabacter salinae]MBV0914087.1 alpha/beta hydrolase [Anianabacter salinae]
MTDLTLADRYFRWNARYIERGMLALVASQPILRRLMEVTAPLGSSLPAGMDISIDADGTHWFRPAGVAADAPVILYIHGGGFTIGSPNTHRGLIGHLAEAAGLRAAAPRYGLAPEHPFPAAPQDATAAYKRLIDSGTPPVAICGDSAGGCLALLVAQAARDAGWPMPRALGLLAPVADLSGDIAERFAQAEDEMLIPPAWAERIRRDYLSGTDPTDPKVSPLFGDLTGLPPTLIQAGDGEALVEDARRLQEAMDDCTLDLWPGMQHVWQIHAGKSPVANRALGRMGQFLRDHAAA